MIGQTISHYRVVEKLGEGGMGVVWKAEDTQLRRTVALKFLSAQAVENEEVKTRLIREAQASASLDHPNICPVYGIHEEGTDTFIAMAYIDGPSLADKIKERPLPLKEALDIATQIAEGLQEAHEKGIVHRDIKPQNVMLTSKGQVKIMDFGLASLAGRSKITKSGTTLGTPAYMAPEQLEGREVDRRADIWALGCVLYEMFTQRTPFEADYEQAIAYGILNEDPEPATALRGGLPTKLDAILDKALAKSPGDRFQTAADLAVDLRAATAQPSVARTTGRRPAWQLRASWYVAAGLSLLGAAVVFWALRGERRDAPQNFRVSRVTFTPEMEWDFSATPNSSLMAYSSAAVGNMDIYVMPLAGGTPLQLTDYPSDETQPSLSPDGNLIAFHSNRGGGTLYTVPVTGGTPRLLTLTNDPRIYPPSMGLSPWRVKSGRQELLFSRTEADGRRAIWKIDLTSREETRLSPPEAKEHQTNASYSPDGEQILFSQGGDLWTMPAEGGGPRRLLPGAGRASWTPDATRVLFEKQRNLWELTVATGELRQLTVGPGQDWGPILIPDRGLFYIQFNHTFDLFRVDLESREHKALTAASDVSQMYPRFSPKGRFLAFDSNRGGGYEIFKLDLESGETTQLTDNTMGDRYPDWAPTSDELVFVSNREGEAALWLMDAEGARSRRLDLAPGAVRPRLRGGGEELGPPRWAPTGKIIGYLGSGENGPELWGVRADGGGATRLLSGVHSFDWYGASGRVVVYNSTGRDQSVGAELRAVNLDTNEELVLLEGLHANLDVAPDGSSVAYVTQDGHTSQKYVLLPLTPPGEMEGLPRAAGPPEQFIDGGGLWHTHAGTFSADGSSFFYDRDLDEGDILLIENFE